MKVDALPERTGVSIPTLRLYERKGLISLAERTEGRFRIFSEDQRIRLEFIKTLRSFGIPLEDVRDLIALSEGNVAPVGPARADAIAREIEIKLEKLQKFAMRLFDAVAGDQPFEAI